MGTGINQKLLEFLSFKNITPGTIVIGCITEIESTHLKVSLPGKMYGKIPITSISNAYTTLLQDIVRTNETNEVSASPLKLVSLINGSCHC